jgi:hypothetical protein
MGANIAIRGRQRQSSIPALSQAFCNTVFTQAERRASCREPRITRHDSRMTAFCYTPIPAFARHETRLENTCCKTRARVGG